MKVFTQINIKSTFLAVFITSLFVLIINSIKQLLLIERGNAAGRFIEAILKEYEYCKKVMKKHFKNNDNNNYD